MNKKLFILATAALLSVFAGCKKVEDPKDDSSTGGNGAAAPEITAIAPQSGPVGTAVVISGKNFSATDTKVLFGAAEAVISDATATTLSVVAPQNELGQVTVKVTVGSKSATTAFTYTEAAVAAPVVSDQSATEGKAGSTLIFSGENLGTETAAYVVKFNNLEAEITDVTADAITVKVPASDGTSSAVVKVIPVGSETALYLGEFTWKFSRTVALGAIAGEIFEANKSLAIPVTITADEDAEELTSDDVTVTFIDVNDPSKTYVATEVIVEEAGFTPIIPNKLKGEFKVKVEVAEALPVESAASFVVYYLPQYRVDIYAGAYGRNRNHSGELINQSGFVGCAIQGPEGLAWDSNGRLWVTTRGGDGISNPNNNTLTDPTNADEATTISKDKRHCIGYIDQNASYYTMVHRLPKVNEGVAQANDKTSNGAPFPYAIAFDSNGHAHVALKQGLKGKCTIGKWNGTSWSTYDVSGWTTSSKTAYVHPIDLLFDNNDNLYIADRDGCRIVVVKNGAYVKEYSTVVPQGVLDSEKESNIQVASIAWDAKKENIFIGADNDRVILMLNVATGDLTHVAGQYGVCSVEYTMDSNSLPTAIKTTPIKFTDGTVGQPKTCTMGNISGIVCDKDGYVYFNDTHSAAVRVLIPGKNGDYTKGLVKTILGKPGQETGRTNANQKYWYYIDGDINTAFFSQRGKIVVDPQGNLYVSSFVGAAIRRITPIAE